MMQESLFDIASYGSRTRRACLGLAGRSRWSGRRIVQAAALVLLAAVLPLSSGRAQPALEALYEVSVAGLRIGTAVVSLRPGADRTESEFLFTAEGVLGMLGRIESRAWGSSRHDAAAIMPASYRGDFRRDEQHRLTEIAYGGTGEIERLEISLRERKRPGGLPAELARGTVDPFTAFLQARSWLAAQEPSAAVLKLPIFDGRRRYDLRVERLGAGAATLDGQAVPALRLGISSITLALIDDETGEVETNDPAWRERRSELLVSADGRLLPLMLTSVGGRLPFRVALAEDCAAQALTCAAID